MAGADELGRGRARDDPRWVIGGLLGLIAVVWLPTLGHGLVYDDGWTILSNGFLRRPQDLGVLFSPEAAARHVPDAFRPTLVVFDVLAYQVFGESALWHHGLSVFLHLSACLLLAVWLRQLGAPLALRAGAVALFGLMAIHAEVVAVVSFREDLLAAVAGLAALVLASDAASSRGGARSRRLWLGLGASSLMAIAAGAKLSAAMLPGLWLLAHLLSPWRPRGPWRPTLLLAASLQAATTLTLLQTHWVYGAVSPYDPAANPRVLASRVGSIPVLAESTRIHVDYLRQMLLPFWLSPEYTDRAGDWSDPATIGAAALLLAILALGLWAAARKRPVLALSVLGGLWLAVPTSNLFGMPNMQADRFMYLPSLPVCIGLGAGLLGLGRRLAEARAPDLLTAPAIAPLLIFAVLQGAMARATASVYATNATLWQVAVERAPDSARAHAMVGLTLLRQNEGRELWDSDLLARVGSHCARATELDPEYELPELCHARLAVARRDWEPAHGHFARALELSPDRNDRTLAALARVSLDRPGLGSAARRSEAYAHLVRGLREYPYSPDLAVAAGQIAHQTGHPWLALELYRRARRLRPERWETVIAGLELALDLGDAAAARRTWLQAHETLDRADLSVRSALSARLTDANRLHPTPLLHSLLDPGVFPDDP